MTIQELQEKFDEFYALHNGQPLEFVDSSNLDQCIDLACSFINYIGIPASSVAGHDYAYEFYTDPSDLTLAYFKLIPNTSDFVPQKGDLVVWSKAYNGVAGHIGVANGTGDTNSFQCFVQNDPIGHVCWIKTYDYNCVLGVLRPNTTSSTSTTTSSSSNMTGADINANKATQVDQSLTFLKNQGYITSDDSTQYYDGKFTTLIEKLYNDYKLQMARAGSYDLVCNFLGFQDSTKVSAQDIINLITPWKTAGDSLASITAEKNSLAVRLNECQTQSQVYKAEYDNANSPTGYKAQIASLEADKKTWIDKETNYVKQIKTLQTKIDTLKSPIKKILSDILDKLNECVKV